jgi:hypothetical protein
MDLENQSMKPKTHRAPRPAGVLVIVFEALDAKEIGTITVGSFTYRETTAWMYILYAAWQDLR